VTGIVDSAAALLDLIESLRLKQVDLFGYQGGSLAALELALARPEQVRRVALLGVPGPDAGYQTGERLPLLKQPTLVLRARDDYWETTARADALLRDARRIDLGCPHANVLEAGTDEVVRIVRDFLDR
jgi:pimeloyl-ACP methyl ester carboxylesterase